MAARRTLVGKQSDEAAFRDALVGWEPVPGRQAILHGVFECEHVDFVGIDRPDAPSVNLAAPIPVPGEPERWLYFRDVPWAAYTEDLVAVLVQRSSH